MSDIETRLREMFANVADTTDVPPPPPLATRRVRGSIARRLRGTGDIGITTAVTKRPSRRKRIVIGAGLGVVLLGGTTAAYAGGLIPHAVEDSFSRTKDHFPIKGEPYQLVDLTLSDGTHYRVWRAANMKGGQCEVVDEGTTPVSADDFGAECWLYPKTHEDGTEAIAIHGRSKAGLQVLYGQVSSKAANASTAVITGSGFSYTVSVDPQFGGFAKELPRLPEGAPVTVRYLHGATTLRTERVAIYCTGFCPHTDPAK